MVCERIAAQLSSGRKKLSGSLLSVAQPVRGQIVVHLHQACLLEAPLYRHDGDVDAHLAEIGLDQLGGFQRARVVRLRGGRHPQLQVQLADAGLPQHFA